MNLSLLSPFVIFPDEAIKAIESKKDEFYTWVILHTLMMRNDFKEDALDSVITHYTPINSVDNFLRLQLKFLLIRFFQNSATGKKEISELIGFWLSNINGKFPLNSTELTLKLISPTDHILLNTYGRYYYSFTSYKKYVESWNNCTVDLSTWKFFRYLSIPNDFNFIKPLFMELGDLNFPVSHMRKLFDEYVVEIYNRKFSTRLSEKILVEKDKAILERVMQNIGSNDDKKYLNNQFINFYSWTTISDNLSNCLANKLSFPQLDIHDQWHFANYFALIKYYKALTEKSQKKEGKTTVPAIWFKNLPSDIKKKGEVFDVLHDVYDMINMNCPKSNWGDFKSVFNKNGASVKIEWVGDASLLNYVFRKLNKVLSFNESKWEVIAHYFYRVDETDKLLQPEKLKNNSHFKETENTNLVNRLNDLITTLSN